MKTETIHLQNMEKQDSFISFIKGSRHWFIFLVENPGFKRWYPCSPCRGILQGAVSYTCSASAVPVRFAKAAEVAS